MSKDNAPVGNTCGTIDSIISYAEDVRSDNAALREWGNDLYEQLTDMECERDNALAEVETLKDKVSELQDELNEIKALVNIID
jgi:uncharacterized coiled-coil DUF342 family protein